MCVWLIMYVDTMQMVNLSWRRDQKDLKLMVNLYTYNVLYAIREPIIPYIASNVLHTPFEVHAPKGSEKPLLCLSPNHGKQSCMYEWEVNIDHRWTAVMTDTCLLYARSPGEYRCWVRCESGFLKGSPFLFTLKGINMYSSLLNDKSLNTCEQFPHNHGGHCIQT